MKIIFVLSMLLGSLYTFAETIIGNGGDVIVCPQTDGTSSVELLDFFEAKLLRNQMIEEFPSNAQWTDILNTRFEAIAQVDKYFADSLKYEYLNGFSEARFLDNIELSDIDDSSQLALPIGCKIHQIAINRADHFEGEPAYIVDQNLWNQLNETNKAALVLHELTFVLFDQEETLCKRSCSDKTKKVTAPFSKSVAVRRYTSVFFEKNFRAYLPDLEAYTEFIKSIKYKKVLTLDLPGFEYPPTFEVTDLYTMADMFMTGRIVIDRFSSSSMPNYYLHPVFGKITLSGEIGIAWERNKVWQGTIDSYDKAIEVLGLSVMPTGRFSFDHHDTNAFSYLTFRPNLTNPIFKYGINDIELDGYTAFNWIQGQQYPGTIYFQTDTVHTLKTSAGDRLKLRGSKWTKIFPEDIDSYEIAFYPDNGSPEVGLLNEAMRIRISKHTKVLVGQGRVELYPDGFLRGGIAGENMKLKNNLGEIQNVRGGTPIAFDGNGLLIKQ